MATYQYPVKEPIAALRVTEPDFEPDLLDKDKQLYVPLDKVRGKKYRTEIFPQLGILPGQDLIPNESNQYVKIIISGHRGCGKTTELKRIAQELNNPKRYVAVFFSISDETAYGAFQPEDLFVWIILKVVTELKERGITAGTESLTKLAKQLLSETTLQKELKSTTQAEVSLEEGINWQWLINFKAVAKGVFGSSSQESKTIREQVKRNTLAIIDEFNVALIDIRKKIRKAGLGHDIVFIVDGPEKLKSDVYKTLFVTDAHLLQALNMNLISTVPIDAYYNIEGAPTPFTHRYTLPMVRLQTNPAANECFRELVTKRVQEDIFFEVGVLDNCIHYSGGCIRQLFHIVNQVILTAIGKQPERGHVKATATDLTEVIHDLGQEKYELLTNDHLAILKDGGPYLPGNPKVREMLFQLILLKYNGESEVNPLLTEYLYPSNG